VLIFPLNENAQDILEDVERNYTRKKQRAMVFQLLHKIIHNSKEGHPFFTKQQRERILHDFLPKSEQKECEYIVDKMLDPFIFSKLENKHIQF